MIDLSFLLEKIDSLRAELNSLKPLKQVDEERLWKKFRLEWNFNSNHIEGNTLTYGQTELLLIFDKTTGDHDMREYEEMKAHDVAIKLIREYARDFSRTLTEADVRELNKIILVRPYWGNAQTPDGQPTRKEIIPGEYKKQPNSVRLQNGEMFHYASPEETPAKMAELMEWYRKAESKKKFHPLQLAAKIHYDFVRIHPFDDSNGRTSRLLMNYVLLRQGFPPVIIKSADKKNYLTALNKADVGDLDSFIEYVGKQLIWSLEINIKAAKGESIEEDEDLYKEIEVWEKSIAKADIERPVKNTDFMREFLLDSLMPFYDELILRYSKFNKFFVSSQIHVFESGSGNLIHSSGEIKEFFWEKIKSYDNNSSSFNVDFQTWGIRFQYLIYKASPEKRLYFNASIDVEFHPLQIEIKSGTPQKVIKTMYYSDSANNLNISEIVRICISEDFKRLKDLENQKG